MQARVKYRHAVKFVLLSLQASTRYWSTAKTSQTPSLRKLSNGYGQSTNWTSETSGLRLSHSQGCRNCGLLLRGFRKGGSEQKSSSWVAWEWPKDDLRAISWWDPPFRTPLWGAVILLIFLVCGLLLRGLTVSIPGEDRAMYSCIRDRTSCEYMVAEPDLHDEITIRNHHMSTSVETQIRILLCQHWNQHPRS